MSIQILCPFLNWAVGFFGHIHTAVFISLFMAVLGLCCCTWAFSSCREWGLLSSRVHRLLTVVLLFGGAWALCVQASVAVALGLSCSLARGIFPDQGLDLCPLNWQADSYLSCGILVL